VSVCAAAGGKCVPGARHDLVLPLDPGRLSDHLRIQRACELLRQPKFTLEDICREIGYSNVSYFNKLFKSRTGHTPGQYRLLQATDQLSGANQTETLSLAWIPC